jgi:hypothetical protein
MVRSGILSGIEALLRRPGNDGALPLSRAGRVGVGVQRSEMSRCAKSGSCTATESDSIRPLCLCDKIAKVFVDWQ